MNVCFLCEEGFGRAPSYLALLHALHGMPVHVALPGIMSGLCAGHRSAVIDEARATVRRYGDPDIRCPQTHNEAHLRDCPMLPFATERLDSKTDCLCYPPPPGHPAAGFGPCGTLMVHPQCPVHGVGKHG